MSIKEKISEKLNDMSPAMFKILTAIVVIAIIGGIFVGMGMLYSSTLEEHTITIEEKQVNIIEGQKVYTVSDTEDNVYKVTDVCLPMLDGHIIFFDYRSADRYAKLDVGDTFTVKTIGWRFGLTSSMKNIISIEEIQPSSLSDEIVSIEEI